jgi:transposase InsO family protein
MLCRLAGMTRQNYYKQRSRREQWSVDERLVLELIQRERCRQPRLGGRKLMRLIGGDMNAAGVSLGRDRFFMLLRHNDLFIQSKRRVARTTDSRHGFGVYPNLARSLELSGPHQLWVSDITYIRTLEGFLYLCLVMDAFSRAIVGWDCSDSLEMEGALRALSIALKQLPSESRIMHHSDRGAQYCCGAYIERLMEAGAAISMTEANHCYENSQAERLNGTLKREYGLGGTLGSKALAKSVASEAVVLYNHHRPHQALDYRMPMQVHQGSCEPVGWAVKA